MSSPFQQLQVKNYKSIQDLSIPLARVNVFIGSNGCGKSNLLEAVALAMAERDYRVKISDLQQVGVRITKPELMKNSFRGERSSKEIQVILSNAAGYTSEHVFVPESGDIFSDWVNVSSPALTHAAIKEIMKGLNHDDILKLFEKAVERYEETQQPPLDEKDTENEFLHSLIRKAQGRRQGKDYVIYDLNTNALRGIQSHSTIQPLGIYGEGLDLLLSTFSEQEWKILKSHGHLIEWLDEIRIDQEDRLKREGHKLGRSSSHLYFTDKFMRKNNNLFSSENSNEGVLHVLFYLALFISKKTPSFFAIDNIESSLNPRICRELMKALTNLAKESEDHKQVLITTHNPAILDGLNLHDPEQALFVVKRSDKGDTRADRIKLKPSIQGEEGLKLSEMWMRGHLGGLPNNF